MFSKNPAIISAVGFSGHGKTVYLASLLHALSKILTQIWPRFYRQGLDVDTVKRVQENMALLQRGDLPESTRRNFPKPSIHLLAEMPHFGTRDVLIYDPPGEAFNDDAGIERYAHFIRRARVVLFLVSVIDLQPPKDEDLYRLLNTYVLGMSKLNARTRDQHLIVVYTKADRLISVLKHSFSARPDRGLARACLASVISEFFEQSYAIRRVSQSGERLLWQKPNALFGGFFSWLAR